MIVLIGQFGVGKTTLGKALANALSLPFYDTDHLLEEKMGLSCRDLMHKFPRKFRDFEYEILKKALKNPQGVLSIGGGAPTYPLSYLLLKKCSKVVYLKGAPFSERLLPISLQGKDLKSQIERRKKVYEKLASISFEKEISVEDLVIYSQNS